MGVISVIRVRIVGADAGYAIEQVVEVCSYDVVFCWNLKGPLRGFVLEMIVVSFYGLAFYRYIDIYGLARLYDYRVEISGPVYLD